MKTGKCPRCGEIKPLTKHSKKGYHQPPFKLLCRICHNKEHDMRPVKPRSNKKYQPGTAWHKKKKK